MHPAGFNTTWRPGDDNLTWGIEVRNPHLVVGKVAGNLNLVVVKAEHCCHCPRLFVAGIVHCIGAFLYERDAFREAECSRSGEGGVFTEAVSGENVG